MLNDLLDKAQTLLHDVRHAETTAAHSFTMLKPFPEDQLALNKDFKQADAEFTSLDAGKPSLRRRSRVGSCGIA